MTDVPPTDGTPVDVRLVDVDEVVLAELVGVATADAAADEVTAPVTPGPDWTPERIAWMQELHRSCRARGPGGGDERTWAIVADGHAVGAVRLKRVGAGEVETGIWLARAVRRRGVALRAIGLVVDEARAAGATRLRADTTAGNHRAQILLRRLGFTLAEPDGDRVDAELDLRPRD